MIKFSKSGDQLLLKYQADGWNNSSWIDEDLNKHGEVTLRRTFTFELTDLVNSSQSSDPEENKEHIFLLGILEGSYYKIRKDILGLKHDLLLSDAMEIKPRIFIAQRDISIFHRVDDLIDEPIVVGGNDERAIPISDLELLLTTFPTTTELTHYASTRITRVLKDYFGTISDAEGKLNRYLNNKENLPTQARENIVASFELQKFEYVHAELKAMLAESDSYEEKVWQKKILDLLLFIFPKYIAVLENVHIKDFYSKPDKVTDRYIDLMLVDAHGNIDIIEVKKPFSNALLSRNKYRNNHTPRNELAGTIMQAEKYLFHLCKWGSTGEKEIYKKRKSELPEGINLKVTNPKALILLGRDNDFTGEQRFDFEIVRRQYANMFDIMTYDDLLRRLENIIAMMKRAITARSPK